MTFRSELVAEPWRFDLFAVLRRLERENPGNPRIGDARSLADEFVTVCQDPYFEFPASNLESAEIASGRIRLKAKFLGMFGPKAPCPLRSPTRHTPGFAKGMRPFRRRLPMALLGVVLSRLGGRPARRPERSARGGSLSRLYRLDDRNRNPGAPRGRLISDFAKLQFAGLLAARVKSASRLRSFLSSLLGARVEIDEFVGTWLLFDPSERTRLGSANSRLGEDCVAGASMFGVSDKFRVRVYVRDIEHFRRFLPGSALAEEIADAIFLYVGEEYDWDMELAIRPARSRPFASAKTSSSAGRVGWRRIGPRPTRRSAGTRDFMS